MSVVSKLKLWSSRCMSTNKTFFWLSQVFGAVGYARELEMEGKRKGEEAKN